MKALITGASSGIGRDMAIYLASIGYELILVSRDKESLEKLQDELPTKVKLIVMDLAVESNVKSLYVICKSEDINVLINNAGFGVYGKFYEIDINRELEMIDVDIKAVHILTKMFLKDMRKKNSGYILNVSSAAAFAPGPLMAAYYSCKSYVYRLTESISYELKKEKSKVSISVLCPGPVETNFSKVAGVNFSMKPLTSEYVAKYAIDNMFKRKLVIIPGFKVKLAKFATHFVSEQFAMKITYNIQKRKEKKY